MSFAGGRGNFWESFPFPLHPPPLQNFLIDIAPLVQTSGVFLFPGTDMVKIIPQQATRQYGKFFASILQNLSQL
jgi:hypothetical protein